MAYCLGITKVDPIEHKLLFERFINEARALPDIDIDFDVNRREEVIQYLYRRYGVDHSAMVCNVITYRARSAVREVAKALAFPPDVVDRIAKALDTRDASEVANDLALDGEFGWLFEELGSQTDTGGTATDVEADPLVVRSNDNTWHFRGRPTLRPDLAAAEARARDAAGDHDGRPYSESGWYPPRRPSPSTSPPSRSATRAGSGSATRQPGRGRPRGARGGGPRERDAGRASSPPAGRHRGVGRGVATDPAAEPMAVAAALCAEIDGFPRHLGIHVGGMLVTRTPITELVPIERATMPGRVVTEYDKEDVEALGLVKIDLLSLRTLGAVSDALDRIERDTAAARPRQPPPRRPGGLRLDQGRRHGGRVPGRVPGPDAGAAQGQPGVFEDLVVQVAIIRPGPVQGNAVHPYLRRRAGLEEAVYAHPSLRPILEDTLGVILYQEQVMQIAITVCGYSATEADIFRKAMGSIGPTRPCSASGIGSLPAPYGPV